MRRYERFSTLLRFNRPVEDWGKLLGDVAFMNIVVLILSDGSFHRIATRGEESCSLAIA